MVDFGDIAYKQIHAVTTANFKDVLYFDKWKDALDFVFDQMEAGLPSMINSYPVEVAEYDRLMATMDQLDSGTIEFMAQWELSRMKGENNELSQ